MKKVLFALFIVFGCSGAYAQILTPVKWAYAAKKISNDEYMVLIRATMDEGWHIYSLHTKEGGPIKTSFTFKPSKDYQVVGTTIEPTPVTKYEKSFQMNVGYFENTVTFQQRVKLKDGKATVKGQLEYQTCNDRQCLPPEDVDFSVNISK